MNFRKIKLISFCAIILGFFMAILDTTIVNITLSQIVKYYNSSMQEISWVVNGYNLSFAVFIVTASRLADQYGRKKIFLIGLMGFTLASFACGFTESVSLLILFRVLQGLAGAIIVPVTIPLVMNLFSPKRYGTILGIWSAFSALAAASGPAIGGFLTEKFNWQAIFFVNVPIGVIAIVVCAVFLKESYDDCSGRTLDVCGIMALSVAMFTITYALIKGNDMGWHSNSILALFGLSILSFVTFFIIESKVKEPLLPLGLLKIIPFDFANLTLFIYGLGMMGAVFMTSFFLTTVMKLSVLDAGLTVSTMPLASIVASVISGPLSNKYGSRIFSVLGMSIITTAIYLLGGLHGESTRQDVILRLVIIGFGMGLTMAPLMGSGVRNTPSDKSGIVSGILNMTRTLGTVFGVAILVAILNSSLNHQVNIMKSTAQNLVISNKVIDHKLKNEIIQELNKTKDLKSSSDDINVNKVIEKIDAQKKLLLQGAKINVQRSKIESLYTIQENEVKKLCAQMKGHIKNGVANAFDDSFKYGSLISVLGIIFAFFSDKKKREYDEAL